MGILDSIFGGKPVSVRKSLTEQGYGLFAVPEGKSVTNEKEEFLLGDNVIAHPYDFEAYESWYSQVPLLQAAVDKQVDFTVGSDYTVRCQDPSLQLVYKQFMHVHRFDGWLRAMIKNMRIYGSSFAEVKWFNGEVIVLRAIDPKTMFIKQERTGKLLGYVQYIGNPKNPRERVKIDFAPDEIIHFAHNRLGSSPYGTSVYRSLLGDGKFSTLMQKLKMEEAMKVQVERKANAKLHIKVGNDLNPALQSDLNSFSSAVEAMTDKTDFVTSHWIDMAVVDFPLKAEQASQLLQYYDSQNIAALQTPDVLLGRGNIAEGLADVQLDAYQCMIKSIQNSVDPILEDDVFKKMAALNGANPDEVEFNWGRWPTGSDKEREQKGYADLLQLQSLHPSTRKEIENKLRANLGIAGDVPEDYEYPPIAYSPFGFPLSPATGQLAQSNLTAIGFESFDDYEFFSDTPVELQEQFKIVNRVVQFLQGYDFALLDEKSKVGQVRRLLIKAVREGWSMKKTINAMAKVFPDRMRAESIVKTELARAENEGALLAYTQSDVVEEVEWVTAGDERVDKHICLDMDGKRFSLEDAKGLLPAHPFCRCRFKPIVR